MPRYKIEINFDADEVAEMNALIDRVEGAICSGGHPAEEPCQTRNWTITAGLADEDDESQSEEWLKEKRDLLEL